tara:strand:- start:181 stop:408 length:228 start_codon:yes stop_codon:yes gene_type:complete
MPFVYLGTLGLIAYKSWQNRGIPIDSVPDPTGMPGWALTDIENEIDKPWYGRFYQDDVILGFLALYIVLSTKPWK